MSYANIASRVTISGYPSGSSFPTTATQALAAIYDGSSLAAQAIDAWLASNPAKNLEIRFLPGAAQAYAGAGIVEIDPAFFNTTYYMSTQGRMVRDTFLSGLAHELGHAVTGRRDDDSFSDLAGPNVRLVNQWFRQLGLEEQASYNAYETQLQATQAGKEYTEGNVVENAIIDRGGAYTNNLATPPFSFNTVNIDLTDKGVTGSTVMVGRDHSNNYKGTRDRDWIHGNGGDDRLDGSDGDDFLYGGADDDTLIGGLGVDELRGEDGRDKLRGGAGDDILHADADDVELDGGAGHDTVDYSESQVAIDWDAAGTEVSSVEEVTGSRFDDVLKLPSTPLVGTIFDRDIRIDGGEGNDVIGGNDADNNLFGGDGNDTIIGKAGDDRIEGGKGDDLITGGDESYLIASDKDHIRGGDGDDRILAGEDDDEVYGDSGDDFIAGGDGKDRLFGGVGNDTIAGGDDDDAINGESGDDRLVGDDGDDVIVGGDGNDTLVGGSGEDRLSGGAGNDIIDGTIDDDGLFGTYADRMWGGSGNDIFLTNDGDVILDIDQGDRVKLLESWLTGGEKEAPPRDPCRDVGDSEEVEDGTYEGADGTEYTLSGTTLVVTSPPGLLGTLFSSTITIEQFRNGDAGIRLKPARPETEQAECNRDPLVIDLDGDRNVVRELFDSYAYFDLDNDGFREHVAWTLPGDGLLVHDRNGNGIIDDGTELFGSGHIESGGSVNPPRLQGAPGFIELATYDANGDGQISAADAGFASLRVWIDASGDGLTDSGELKTLDELGLVSISLKTRVSNDEDCGCDGTDVTFMSSVTRADGSVTGIYDAYFSLDQYDTRELHDVEVPEEFRSLPFLIGSGTLSDLDVAMARDPALESLVRRFAELGPAEVGEVSALVEQIILRWTGADAVAADSRGPGINGRWLAALEEVSGSAFSQFSVGRNPRDDAAAILTSEWQDLVGRVTAQLLGQTALGQAITPGLSFAAAAFHTVAEGTTLSSVLDAAVANAPTDRTDALAYWNTVVSVMLPYRDTFDLTENLLYDAIAGRIPSGVLPVSLSRLASASIVGGASEIAVGVSPFEAGRAAFDGKDVLVAMPGARELVGKGGSDTYLVSHGVASLLITESGGSNDLLSLFDWQRSRTDVQARIDVYDAGAQPSDIDLRLVVNIVSMDTAADVEFQLSFVGGRLEGLEKVAFGDETAQDVYSLLPSAIALPDGSGSLYFGAAGSAAAFAATGGDDLLVGRSLADSYRLAAGSGSDVIAELADAASAGDELFIDALPGEVLFQASGSALQDLTVALAATGDRIAIAEQWSGTGRAVESFRFADGSTLSAAEVQLLVTTGTSADETISGTYGNDRLDGRGGRDLLIGGRGDDVYAFAPGYGALTVKDQEGSNAIELAGGFTLEDLFLRVTAEGLSISFDGSTDSILLTGNPEGNGFSIRAAGVEKSAHALLREQAMLAGTSVNGKTYGTAGDDVVSGSDDADLIDGLGGRDSLRGGLGNDTYVFGGGINSIVDTGFGFDTLQISSEYSLEDIVLTTTGYGRMRIRIEGTDARADLGNGFNYSTGLVDGSGGDDIERIVFADGRSIDIGSGKKLEGSSGNDVLFSYSNGNDTFRPGAGNDRIFALNGRHNVELEAGYGHDVFYPSYNAQIRFLGVPFDDQVTMTRQGHDLLIETGGGADSLLVKNVFEPLAGDRLGSLRFEDRTLYLSDVAAQLAVATDGDDLLFGRAGLDGGAGNDTLIGTSAANHYVFGRGYGHDVIKEQDSNFGDATGDTLTLTGLTRDDVDFSRHPTDPLSVVITIRETGETVTLDGTPFDDFVWSAEDSLGDGYGKGDRSGAHWVNTIIFADGTTMSQRDVEQEILDAERTDGADVLTNFGAPSSSFGGEDGAVLDGGRGDDRLVNNFRDVFVRFGPDSGHDLLENKSDDARVEVHLSGLAPEDVLVLFVERDGRPFTLIRAKDGSELAIEGQISPESQFSIRIVAEDGASYYPQAEGGLVEQQTGTDGIDYLVGAVEYEGGGEIGWQVPADDTFDGGEGDDVIAGRGGHDSVLFDRGDGADLLLAGGLPEGPGEVTFSVIEMDGPGGYHVVLGAGINREDLEINWLNDGSNNVLLDFGGGDSITVDAGSIAGVEFADGRQIAFSSGGSGSILLFAGDYGFGSDGADTFFAIEGDVNVRIAPDAGNDRLIDGFMSGYQPGEVPPTYWEPSSLHLQGGNGLSDFEFVRYLDRPGDLVVTHLASGTTFTIEDQFAAEGASGWLPVDRDGNGSADWGTIDTDGDGAADFLAMDADGDGTPDWASPDFDGDGAPDWVTFREETLDVDGNGSADIYAYDDSGDGLTDIFFLGGAAYPGGEIAFRDTDGDRLPDEYTTDFQSWTAVPLAPGGGKDWAAIDTNGDGVADAAALDADGDGSPDWLSPDFDGDGQSDWRDNSVDELYDADGNYVASRITPAGASGIHYALNIYLPGFGILVARDMDGDLAPDEYGFDSNGDFLPDAGGLVTVSDFILYDDSSPDLSFFFDWSEISDLVIERATSPGGGDGGIEYIDLFEMRPQATAGDDVLQLFHGELVDGLGGNDRLLIRGDDIGVQFGAGGGHDRIVGGSLEAQNVTVFMEGVTDLDEVEFLRGAGDSRDLIIRLVATGETLTIQDQFARDADGYGRPVISHFSLASGQELSWQLVASLAVGIHTGGDSTISSGSGGGTLDGGAGFDTLRGGTGDDNYRFGRGYDEDVVRDAGGRDTILFDSVITSGDLFFSRSGAQGSDLLIEVIGVDRLTMTVVGQFADPSARVETFLFSDGSLLNWRDVERFILDTASTDSDDLILGFRSDDRIRAKNGNDSLTGGEGDDVMDGGAGRDIAVYRGAANEYEVSTVDGVTTVRDLVANRDGTDSLANIEDLRFEGGGGSTLALVATNQAPSAGNLERATAEDSDLVVSRADLLAAAGDPDGDALTLSVSPDRAGGRAWIGADGNFRFRPDANFSGDAFFEYKVADGNGGFAAGRVTVTVSAVNDAPVVAGEVATLVADEDRAFAFDLPTTLFSDADGDSLGLSLETASGAPLPEWLIFADGQVSGQAPADYHGTLALTLVADDGAATAAIAFDLVVQPVNDAPNLIEPLDNLVVVPGASLSIDLAGHFSDVEGDSVQLFVQGAGGAALPDWLSFDGSTLSGVVPHEFTGALVLDVAASDGRDTAHAGFAVSARTNRAPVLALPVEDMDVDEDSAIDIALHDGTFVDPDGDALAISARLEDGSALPEWLAFDGTRFTGIPPANFHGSLALTLTASDGVLEVSAPLTLTIHPVNDAPTAQMPLADVHSAEDQPVDVALPVDLFTDIDGDVLTLDATLQDGAALPDWLQFDGSRFTGTPPSDFNGVIGLRLTASDGAAAAAVDFSLIIDPVNDAPLRVGEIEDVQISDDDSLDLAVPAGLFADPDGDALSLSATLSDGSALPAWLSFDGARFTGAPPAGAAVYDIRVAASDGSASVSDTFTLTVTASNRPPEAVDDGLFLVRGGEALTILASTLLENDVDPDGDPLAIVAVDGASNGTVAIGDDGNILYTPAFGYEGADRIRYTISDGVFTATAWAAIEVTDPFEGWQQGGPNGDLLYGNIFTSNAIYGAGGNDIILGGFRADQLAGGSGNDILTGLSGDDHFWGMGGDDVIIGGSGVDTAHYAGARSSYTVSTHLGNLIVGVADGAAGQDGDEGADTLSSVERLVFQGGETISLAAPVVLDLDGDGVALVDRSASAARFDWNGDGIGDRTGWVGSDDGLLTFDRDGNGTVSGAAELSFIDDKPEARSDLDGLTAFDTNGDGAFSSADAAWGDFHVWRDADGNGVVDEGEYLSMAEAGVTSIGLSATATRQSWGWSDNIVINKGSFGRADGTTADLADVALNYVAGSAAPAPIQLPQGWRDDVRSWWHQPSFWGDERNREPALERSSSQADRSGPAALDPWVLERALEGTGSRTLPDSLAEGRGGVSMGSADSARQLVEAVAAFDVRASADIGLSTWEQQPVWRDYLSAGRGDLRPVHPR